MGCSNLYRYTRCRRKAQVSGGYDCGLMCAVQTVYCLKCKTVQDIVVARWPDYHPDEKVTIPPTPCRRCKGIEYAVWSAGDPCPNCGGNFKCIDEGAGILWD